MKLLGRIIRHIRLHHIDNDGANPHMLCPMATFSVGDWIYGGFMYPRLIVDFDMPEGVFHVGLICSFYKICSCKQSVYYLALDLFEAATGNGLAILARSRYRSRGNSAKT
jgi:hypothetical protein